MRISTAVTVLLIVTFQLLFVMTARGQSISTEKVTLGLKDESMAAAIKKIERQSVFRFFYRNEDIRPLEHLNLMPDTRTIEQTLTALLQNTFLSFRQVDGKILLERKDQQPPYQIRARVMDSINKTPVANASVFFNNSTIGTVTDDNGSFKLTIARRGKYELVVSIVGYATYQKTLFINQGSVNLPDIKITPKIIALSEVKVKTDPNWNRNYKWFKEEFLGNWSLPGNCKILNPEILNFNYDKKNEILTASSSDFLEIENQVLGYKLKYILTRFSSDKKSGRVNYKGSAWFDMLTGDEGWQQIWQKNRIETYKGSVMHFLRSALENQLDAEGFKVLRLKRITNPKDRKRSDINYVEVPGKTALRSDEFIKLTNKKDLYALSFKDCLYVMHTKLHNYTGTFASIPLSAQPGYVKTTLTIVAPYTFFDSNGIIINPESIVFEGYWAESRVAELLPSDYDPNN